jgi:hypothetical protein
MDADLSCLVLTCSTHTNGEGWWRRAEAKVTITTIASGPTWDVDGRDEALVITQGGRWTAACLGCRQDSHKISGGSALCLAPFLHWRRGVWAAETAARCLRFHMFRASLLACLAGQGRAGQMIRSGRGVSRPVTDDGWPLTCDTADEALMAAAWARHRCCGGSMASQANRVDE